VTALGNVHPEVLLMGGYAVLLLAAALGIERMARFSQARSEEYRTLGFVYHEKRDAWECPEGEYLWRSTGDPDRSFVRYRAKAHVCNTCPSKKNCTDSNDGREIRRSLLPWPHSEVGRFHRGLSLSLVLLAGLIIVVEALRHHGPAELIVLGVLFVAVMAMGQHMLSAFRARPANFPVYQGSQTTIPEEALRDGYRKRKERRH
jgi:hypothetical protein